MSATCEISELVPKQKEKPIATLRLIVLVKLR